MAITRRAALGAAAGLGAGLLLEPVAGLAQTVAGSGSVFSRAVGSFSGISPPLRAPRRFSLVGIQWSKPAGARIELRTRGADGRWGPWAIASVLGHEPDTVRDRSRLFGEPIWTGPALTVQLRSSEPVSGAVLHFVAGRTDLASVAAALPLASPVLAAGPGQPPIIARAGWAGDHAPPVVPPSYATVKLAFVHHTETPNGYGSGQVPSILTSIYDYHRFARGYNDIAYNFMIDAYGRIWEARAGGIDLPVLGAHAGGYNAVSTGVAVIGSFMDVVPSAAAIVTLERFLAWKLSLHGLPASGRVTVVVNPSDAFYTPFAPGAHVSLPRIAGHRDGDLTDCPGDALYARLPSIRARAGALAIDKARVSLNAPSSTLVAGATISLSGRLASFSGQAIATAPIELQQIGSGGRETTLQTATTGADGSWNASLTLTDNAILRALHRPAPATVSALAFVALAPKVTLTLASMTPLQVAGTVTPGKRRVTVDIYRLQGAHRQLFASKRVTVRQGQFASRLTIRRAGRYVLIARTSADASNVAGASPPVTITV